MATFFTILLLVTVTLPDSLTLKKIVVDSSTNHIVDVRSQRVPVPPKIETPYFAKLRERVRPIVDASAMDDVETMLSMTAWVSAQWKHDGRMVPPLSMSAAQILDKAASGARFNCEGYARVLTDMLLAHGIVARVVQLRTPDQAYGAPGQVHIAVEAWSNSLQKWIFLDPQLNGHLVQDGRLLNVYEASRLVREGHRDSVQFMNSVLPIEKYEEFLTKHFGYIITLVKNDDHAALLTFALDGKEQFLTFQGLPASGTEFTTRRGDFYPAINETSMAYYFDESTAFDSVMRKYEVRNTDDYMRAMPRFAPQPKFMIEFDNNMPWFSHYEVSIDNKPWSALRGSELAWTLHDGENRIHVRSVNTQKRPGPTTVMHIIYGSEKTERAMPDESSH